MCQGGGEWGGELEGAMEKRKICIFVERERIGEREDV